MEDRPSNHIPHASIYEIMKNKDPLSGRGFPIWRFATASILTIALTGLMVFQASAQGRKEVWQGTGRGNLWGYPAALNVVCTVQVSGMPNDTGSYQKCSGQINTNIGNFEIYYEGYLNLSPYKGALRTPRGDIYIGVLDNSGGKFYIEAGEESLSAPEEYGEFAIHWQRKR